MPSLKKLDCSYNSISSIPDELFDCTELQIIDFYHNSLSMIPDRIEHLERLQKLNVAENAIMIFPENLCKCDKLETLYALKSIGNLARQFWNADIIAYIRCFR